MHTLLPDEVARALAQAQALFQAALPRTAEAWAYVSARRGATEPAAGFGYGLPGYSAILSDCAISLETQRLAGLVDEGGEVFAGRITFPWLSIAGRRVQGMGGRTFLPGDSRSRYVNTPESPWYAKGRVVFGLAAAAAAIHGGGWAVIAEGPFDAAALWEMGWTNAVATVGARVSLDQLLLVARLTDDVVLLLDADEGGTHGREAAERLLRSPLLPSSLRLSYTTLRGANDPGEATPGQVSAAMLGVLPLSGARGVDR